MSLQKRINGYIPGHSVIAYVKMPVNKESSCSVEFHFLPKKTVVIKSLPLDPSETDILAIINEAGKELIDAQSHA